MKAGVCVVGPDCHQQVSVGPVASVLGTADAVVMNQDAGFGAEDVVILSGWAGRTYPQEGRDFVLVSGLILLPCRENLVSYEVVF